MVPWEALLNQTEEKHTFVLFHLYFKKEELFDWVGPMSAQATTARQRGTDPLSPQHHWLGEYYHLSEPQFTQSHDEDNTGPVFVTGFRTASEVNYTTGLGKRAVDFKKLVTMISE